jgi:hypothetical protein
LISFGFSVNQQAIPLNVRGIAGGIFSAICV